MRRSPATLIAACLVLASCSTQILGDLGSTTTSSVVTTTTVPTGDVRTLLGGMLGAVTGLGDAIVAKDSVVTSSALSSVEAVWTALRPQLADIDKRDGLELSVDVERIVNLVRSGVKKKRPADADKAARFLPLVIDALP